MKRVWQTIKNAWQLFVWAHICLWEEFTGEEVSCPKCWKCETARVLMLTFYLVLVTMVMKWVF